MIPKKIFTAATFISATFASQVAFSGTIDVTYAGSANFGSGGVGYEYGKVAPNPNSNTNLVGVGIGGDSFTTTNLSYEFSQTGQFNAWCVDIYHWLSGGKVIYNVQTGNDLATELTSLRPGTPNGATRVSQLVRLANDYYVGLDTKVESAAFQLAVWAISYGSADNTGHYSINTTDANFHTDLNTVNSAWGILANKWLTDLDTAPVTGHYELTYLNDGLRENTQDLIVFTGGNVPEPATVALFGIGFLGMGIYSRKKFAVTRFSGNC